MIFYFGCSFTAGAELAERKNAWPYLLSNKLGDQVPVNFAQDGASNTAILKNALLKTQDQKPDLAIVAWTTPVRVEFSSSNSLPKSYNPHDDDKFITQYYAEYYTDQLAMVNWYTQVFLLQNYFKHNQIEYIFCSAFGAKRLYEECYSIYPDVRLWHSMIDYNHFANYPATDFIDWTTGYPIGSGGHPLEQGHNAIAEKMYEYIRN